MMSSRHHCVCLFSGRNRYKKSPLIGHLHLLLRRFLRLRGICQFQRFPRKWCRIIFVPPWKRRPRLSPIGNRVSIFRHPNWTIVVSISPNNKRHPIFRVAQFHPVLLRKRIIGQILFRLRVWLWPINHWKTKLLCLEFLPFFLRVQNGNVFCNPKLGLCQNAIWQFSTRFPDCRIHYSETLLHQRQWPFSCAIRGCRHRSQTEYN